MSYFLRNYFWENNFSNFHFDDPILFLSTIFFKIHNITFKDKIESFNFVLHLWANFSLNDYLNYFWFNVCWKINHAIHDTTAIFFLDVAALAILTATAFASPDLVNLAMFDHEWMINFSVVELHYYWYICFFYWFNDSFINRVICISKY